MNMSQRIKERRILLGLTQEELANKVGLQKSAIAKYENGRITNAKRTTILKMAEALKCEPSYLMAMDKDKEDRPAVRIPVLGRVAAGIPISAIEEVIDWEEIPARTADSGTYFALRIRGDSMSPRIMEGDVVIIRQQEDVDSGDIAIIRINGDEAVCKRVIKQAGGISLISFNPAYAPMVYSAADVRTVPIVIIGKVVELRGKF